MFEHLRNKPQIAFGFAKALVTELQKRGAFTPLEKLAIARKMAKADRIYSRIKPCGFPKDNNTATLDAFFTPDIMKRIVFCDKAPVDPIGDGRDGYVPGFFLIDHMNYKGSETLNDGWWLEGRSIQVVPNSAFPVLAHGDFFPQSKFAYCLFSPRENPVIFEYLKTKMLTKELKDSNPKEDAAETSNTAQDSASVNARRPKGLVDTTLNYLGLR